MPSMRKQSDPRLPTMPTGLEVASYATYLEAQQAVDRLSDEAFDVRDVTIVGTDLRMVERITGRLTYARVAGAGAMSGAWFGLMIALVYWVFTPDGTFPLLAGVFIGAAFGILFAVVSYAFTGGKRDFTSASQVVASRYSILCKPESAGQARQLIERVSGAGRRSTARADQAPAGRAPSGRAPSEQAGSGRVPSGQSHPGAAPSGQAPPRDADNPYAAPHPGGVPPHEDASARGRHAWRQPAATGDRPGPDAAQPAATGAQPPAGAQPGVGARPSGERVRERPRYGLRLEDLEQDEERTEEKE